ncbi:hypothetical protein D3C78_903330 [compost metagenome]
MQRFFDMAKHHRGGGLDTCGVGSTHDLQPFLGIELVRADDGTDFVVENFGGRPRQGVQSGLAQLPDVIVQGQPQGGGAVDDFQRGERMDMHLRDRLFDGPHECQITMPGVVGMNAALHADFARAALPGFDGPFCDLGRVQLIGRTAQAGRALALGEGAESAPELTNVGVVDVAVLHEGHVVADDLLAQSVCRVGERGKIVVVDGKQLDDLAFVEVELRLHLVENALYVERRPGCRSRAEQASQVFVRRHAGSGAPLVAACKAAGVDAIQYGPCHLLAGPARGRLGECRGKRQALDQVAAALLRLLRQEGNMRPGSLGIDVVGGDGGNTAPVVDAGVDQRFQLSGAQVGRGLNGHLRAEDQPSHGDSPAMVLKARFGLLGHGGVRLGSEVLDDDLLQMAIAGVQLAQSQ